MNDSLRDGFWSCAHFPRTPVSRSFPRNVVVRTHGPSTVLLFSSPNILQWQEQQQLPVVAGGDKFGAGLCKGKGLLEEHSCAWAIFILVCLQKQFLVLQVRIFKSFLLPPLGSVNVLAPAIYYRPPTTWLLVLLINSKGMLAGYFLIILWPGIHTQEKEGVPVGSLLRSPVIMVLCNSCVLWDVVFSVLRP